jgi:hypothetical protein
MLIFGFKIVKHHIIWFVIGMLLLAYVFAFTVVDSVNGIISPNMTWQVPIVLYLLVLLMIGYACSPGFRANRWQLALFGLVLLANAIYGLYYIKVAAAVRSFFI